LARIGLAFAALVSIASASGPAAAHDWNHRHYRHHHHDDGFLSFQFGSPGYYYAPQGYYYYPPPRYYYPPPAYYPPPVYYPPELSFNLVIPLGRHH
jgi:hypothetical protein